MSNRKPDGFFSKMKDEELIRYISLKYSNKKITEFQKEEVRAYTQARKRGLIDILVERGVLFRTIRRNFITGMSNKDLFSYIKENYFGLTLSEFQKECKQAYKIAHRTGLIKRLRDEKIIIAVRPEIQGRGSLKKPYGWKKNWVNVETDIKKVIKQIGHFPTARELENLGSSYLLGGIKFYGGFYKVKERMGYTNEFKPRHYWQSWENFEREFKEMIIKLGHIPSKTELERTGKSDISNALKYHGGMEKVKERMGYSQNNKQLERLLESYAE